MKNSKFKIVILGMTVGLAGVVGINYVLAQWSSPSQGPTDGNVQVPVNIGSATQDKDGVFRAKGLRSFVDLYVDENVGIGTTNPNMKLHIVGNDGVQIQRADNSGFANVYFRTGTDDSTRSSIGFVPAGGANDLVFRVGNLVERFRITSAGNVGIGTTNPNAKLDVAGTARMSGFQLGTSATAGHVLTTNASGVGTWQPSSGGLPSGSSGQTIRHDGNTWIGSSNLFNNGTNVGIGTTNPNAKLHVQGNLRIVDGSQGTGKVLTSDASGLASWQAPSGGGGDIPNLQQVTDVGANTTRSITINPASGQLAAVSFGTGANNNYIIGRPADQTYFNIYDVAGNKDFLMGNPNGHLSLQPSSGNVQIGAGTPSERLSVNGNIALTGNHRTLRTTNGNLTLGVPNAINALTIQSGNGNVSIGPYAVAGRVLHVARAGSAVTINTVSSTHGGNSALDLMTRWDAGGTGTPDSKGWAILARGDSYSPGQGDPSSPNDLVFGFWNSNTWMPEPMRLKNNGELYARNFIETSDVSLKQNINTLSDSLSKILELRGVSFNWKDRGDDSDQIGFIAQEVEQIFPELVKGEEGSKSVSYTSLVPVLVEAVKDLDAKNKELESRLEKLESRLGITNR